MNEQANSGEPAYPLTGMSNALEIAKSVCDAGGAKSDVSKDLIASQLHVSATSGAFLQRLSSARAWGMIDGRGAYRLTREAEAYFYPSSSSDRRRALLSFLAAPRVFSELLKRFDGTKLPEDPEMLGNILQRDMKVGASWKMRVAGFFLKGAMLAEVLDGQGFLRYRAALDAMDSVTQQSSIPVPGPARHPNAPIQMTDPLADYQPPRTANVWVFSLSGQTVRVEASDTLSPELWNKLNAYIQVLKPSEEDKRV